MAKGNHLSNHQRKIVNRYYEHRDTIAVNKLSELVSELYLTTSEKKTETLWKQVATHLKPAGADPATAQKILDSRDLQKLAALLAQLT